MDQKLAELYGTNQPEGDDVEKLAAAQLAEELGDGGEIDVSNLSDEDVEALAAQTLAAEAGEEVVPAGDPQEQAQEKLAEADYLGRVMAHAYVQELRGIEKEAAKSDMAGKVMKGLKGLKSKGLKGLGAAKEKGKAGLKMVKKHKGAVGAAAGGAAAGGAAGFMAGKKSKESSALDTLAERRVLEILEANGIDPEQLSAVETEEQTKTSAPVAEVLDAAVTNRAAEILAQYGLELEAAAEE
jgi:hypothetical protein